MAHALDLPFTGRTLLGAVDRIIGDDSQFNFSITVEEDETILGFENPKSGNRMIVRFPSRGLDVPSWLVGKTLVTKTTSSIDTSRRWGGGLGECVVVVVSLHGVWLTANDAPNWCYTSSPLQIESDELVNFNQYLGGEAIFDADGRYEVNCQSKVTYKTVQMGKSALGKAGRSKPQGNLVVYFSKESCAIEGHNATGAQTLAFQSAGTARQIDSYESTLEDEILGVKFSYPTLFDLLFSKRNGILSSAPKGKMSYGVSDTGKPVVEFDFTGCEEDHELAGCIITIVHEDGESVADTDKELPALKYGQKTTEAKVKVAALMPTEVDLTRFPEQHREMIKEWFDCHIQEQTSRGKVPSDAIDKWFLSYLMKCAVDGTEVSEEANTVFNEVKSL